MQRNTLFVQTKRAFGQRWKTSLFARQKLVRELSIVLLIKLVLLYGLINFVVPSASVINDSDVSSRLLNPQLPASEQTSADASGSAPRSTVTEADLLKAATSEPTASTQREIP